MSNSKIPQLAKEQYSDDYLKRYLRLAAHGKDERIKVLFDRWDLYHKRDGLCDNFQVMRAIMGVANNSDDFFYITSTMFFEQRSDIKKSMSKEEKKGFSKCARAYLMRRSTVIHLRSLTPQFATFIDECASPAFYEMHYNVDSCGRSTVEHPKTADGDADEEEECEERDMGDTSTYKSKPLLQTFLISLMKGKYDRTFAAIIVNNSSELDLTNSLAVPIKREMDKILAAYKEDFMQPADKPHDIWVPTVGAAGDGWVALQGWHARGG